MYIAVLDEFPDYMTPTLVAHSVLGYHLLMQSVPEYELWLTTSFKKVTIRVNRKEFDKITALQRTHLFHENNTLNGQKSCAVTIVGDDVPNVLKFAKLWKPVVE